MKGLILVVILTVLAIKAKCDEEPINNNSENKEKRLELQRFDSLFNFRDENSPNPMTQSALFNFLQNLSPLLRDEEPINNNPENKEKRFESHRIPYDTMYFANQNVPNLMTSIRVCEQEKENLHVHILELNIRILNLSQRVKQLHEEVIAAKLKSEESAEKPVEKSVEKEDVEDVKEESAEKPVEKSVETEDVKDVKDVKVESTEKPVEKSVEKEDVKKESAEKISVEQKDSDESYYDDSVKDYDDHVPIDWPWRSLRNPEKRMFFGV